MVSVSKQNSKCLAMAQSEGYPVNVHLEWLCDDVEIYRLDSEHSMVDKYPDG